jgi:hypothetical protein
MQRWFVRTLYKQVPSFLGTIFQGHYGSKVTVEIGAEVKKMPPFRNTWTEINKWTIDNLVLYDVLS